MRVVTAVPRSEEKILTAVESKQLLAKDHVDKNDKTLHLQKVNNLHAQLRDFLKPFNGVSWLV